MMTSASLDLVWPRLLVLDISGPLRSADTQEASTDLGNNWKERWWLYSSAQAVGKWHLAWLQQGSFLLYTFCYSTQLCERTSLKEENHHQPSCSFFLLLFALLSWKICKEMTRKVEHKSERVSSHLAASSREVTPTNDREELRCFAEHWLRTKRDHPAAVFRLCRRSWRGVLAIDSQSEMHSLQAWKFLQLKKSFFLRFKFKLCLSSIFILHFLSTPEKNRLKLLFQHHDLGDFKERSNFVQISS